MAARMFVLFEDPVRVVLVDDLVGLPQIQIVGLQAGGARL